MARCGTQNVMKIESTLICGPFPGVQAWDDEATGRPTIGDDEHCCKGHHADSRIYTKFEVPTRANGEVGMTNEEMISLMDPRVGPNLNYPVYHHFRWDHCASVGEPFD